MLALFFATYAAVFLAEIAGDKLLYTTGVLSSRYRPLPIMVGVTIAFMAKMAVAVAAGRRDPLAADRLVRRRARDGHQRGARRVDRSRCA